MMPTSPAARTLTAALCVELGNSGQLVGPATGDGQPRFALFHAANSICSQKARAVLAHHGIPYVSHTLDIFAGQTYLPDYVRLRLIGCESIGLPLVTTHTGSTSATAHGCDPAVVPTLVDWRTDEVIVDSKRICLHLDATMSDASRLRPAALQREIDAELDIVDELPNYQLLTGRQAGADPRPERLRKLDGAEFSRSKVRRCDEHLAGYGGDPALIAAYRAKRAKELNAAQALFSEQSMQRAIATVAAASAQLDERLPGGDAVWLLGDAPTLADLFWAIELLRLENLGFGSLWDHGKLPRVGRFVATAKTLNSVRTAVLEWPGAQF